MTHSQAYSRRPVVSVWKGEVLANSRDVAEYFEKEHRNVLRDIDALIAAEPALGGLPRFGETPLLRSEQGSQGLYFFEDAYFLPETGPQRHRLFHMTKSGFMLLVMGFTGPKALKLKLTYIEEFDRMKAELERRAAPQIETPASAPEIGESIREQRLSLDMVREARILFGHGAARKMWRDMGMPAPISTDPGLPQTVIEDSAIYDWKGALSHLLQWPMPLPEAEGDNMERWIRAAAEVNGEWIKGRTPDEVRRALRACGVIAEANHRPSLTIATSHPWLAACFLETVWAYGLWRKAFAHAPGAEKMGATRFNAHVSKAVRLPLSLVLAP